MKSRTPSTNDVRDSYILGRLFGGTATTDRSGGEFDRWLEAHDQGVRDAVKPPAMTAKEHLEAAFEAAHEVPPNGRIPKGTKYLTRCGGQDVVTAEAGIDLRGGPDIRTLEPLPPVIPDDCNAVWASTREDGSRRVWVRATDGENFLDLWDNGNLDADYTDGTDLIDPKPVPEPGDDDE